ncbi:MAG: Zn(II)2Cys6 transcription factor [Oxalobacteraceae bacterium]|nr:MAG: Zn(II)2Cys6 transcription factor [Oxalobacteraceae bacterium]
MPKPYQLIILMETQGQGPPREGSAEGSNAARRRSRAGCLTCRRRRVSGEIPSAIDQQVKCDENRPTCGKCSERSTHCEWPAARVTSQHNYPRAIRSCESCRARKVRSSYQLPVADDVDQMRK